MPTDETTRNRPNPIAPCRSGRQLLRLDRPAGPEARAAAAESGGLFDLILKTFRAEPENRRRQHRHPAVREAVWVGWWDRENFGAVNGRLVNLSRGGALVVVGCRPPRREPVWIYKEVGGTLASVRGEVAGATPAPDAAFAVRFRFLAPCPTTLCQALLCE